jgi:hypothetical protein
MFFKLNIRPVCNGYPRSLFRCNVFTIILILMLIKLKMGPSKWWMLRTDVFISGLTVFEDTKNVLSHV